MIKKTIISKNKLNNIIDLNNSLIKQIMPIIYIKDQQEFNHRKNNNNYQEEKVQLKLNSIKNRKVPTTTQNIKKRLNKFNSKGSKPTKENKKS